MVPIRVAVRVVQSTGTKAHGGSISSAVFSRAKWRGITTWLPTARTVILQWSLYKSTTLGNCLILKDNFKVRRPKKAARETIDCIRENAVTRAYPTRQVIDAKRYFRQQETRCRGR